MKLVVGLGNPGEEYKNNRHNVGFMVIDSIVKKLLVSPHVEKKLDSLVFYHHKSGTVLARPQTFMNSSGIAVKKLIDHYEVNLSELWIIHDDLDIRLGDYKIQKDKGPKLHYGVKSIEEELGSSDFWRVRIGVDNRDPEDRIPGEEYILQDFNQKERFLVNQLINKVVKDLVARLTSTNYHE